MSLGEKDGDAILKGLAEEEARKSSVLRLEPNIEQVPGRGKKGESGQNGQVRAWGANSGPCWPQHTGRQAEEDAKATL